MAKLIPNRFNGNKCKSCRQPQSTGVTIAWLGKGEGINCLACHERIQEYRQELQTKSEENVMEQAVEQAKAELGPVKPIDDMNVEELRKAARAAGFQGGTVLLTLSKAQLLEWLKTGQYTPKPFEPIQAPQTSTKPSILGDLFEQEIRRIAGEVSPKSLDLEQYAAQIEATYGKVFQGLRVELEEQVRKLVTTPYEIHLPDQKVVKLEKRTHASFEKALKLASIHKTVLLVGPAGTGKSTLGEHIAEALGVEHGFINCSGGTSESQFLGRPTPEGGYVQTLFVKLFEQGGVFVADEIDGADANVLMVLNAALANGHMALPARQANPIAKRHKDFIFIGCANTYGTANSIEYAGRNQLDAATLDRFGGGASRLYVDFDSKLEASFAGEYVNELVELVTMRKKASEGKIRRVIGTRAVIAMARERAAGIDFADFKSRLLLGWSDTERAKVA